MKCTNCHSEMTYFIEGQCCGWKCPKCGESLVTTYYSALEMDSTKYSISVPVNGDNNMAKIKAVSEVLNCNFLQAKVRLKAGFTISNVSASDATKIIKTLKNAELIFSTFPDFPHYDAIN